MHDSFSLELDVGLGIYFESDVFRTHIVCFLLFIVVWMKLAQIKVCRCWGLCYLRRPETLGFMHYLVLHNVVERDSTTLCGHHNK